MEDPPYVVGSVIKALRILELLRVNSAMSVHQLGSELGITRSTVHRLLATLRSRGFVDQDPSSREYRLGPFLRAAGVEPLREIRLREAARPHLAALCARHDETVQLVVLSGLECRFLDGVSADRPLRTSVRIGSMLPAYATSGGKALLAELTNPEVVALLADRLAPMTPQTVPDVATLLEQLAFVRVHGYAVNDRETEEGITAFATVVRAAGSAVAAIAMSLPSVRARAELVPDLVAALTRTAGAIGAELG